MINKLFVGRLPYSSNDSDLQQLFAQIGNVLSAKVITDRYSGQSKGFGFVEMETPELAQEAIDKLNGTDFGGRKIIVNEAKPQERRDDNRGFNGRNNDRNQRGNRDFKSNKRW